MQYLFIAYYCDDNAIMTFPMKNRSDAEFIRVLIKFYKCFKYRVIPPNLHILDNECSDSARKIIKQNNEIFQLVEPYNKQVNAAERTIRTFKNHLIVGLCTTFSLTTLRPSHRTSQRYP